MWETARERPRKKCAGKHDCDRTVYRETERERESGFRNRENKVYGLTEGNPIEAQRQRKQRKERQESVDWRRKE